MPEESRFQILYRLFFRSDSNSATRHRVHAGCALVRLDFLPRLPDSPLRDIERLARCFQLVHAIPPGALPVDRTNQATNDPAPSLRPRYRGFTATTNRSASASRDGTRPLAVQPLGVLPAGRPRNGTGQCRDAPSPVPCGSRRPGSRRLHAGHHLASKRISARLIPESPKHPGFDVVLGFRHVSNDSLALAFPVPA